MPLSPAALDELKAELAAIETWRQQVNDRLDARAAVIKAVLQPFDFSQTALPFSAAESHTATTRNLMTPPAVSIAVASKFASTGLRAAILDVLKSHGPMKAPHVAKILENTGFKNDSKTALATRVYNDLWRMKEAGIVESRDGKFVLKEVA